MYVLIGLLVAVIVVHFVARFFEYDSDGAQVIITNSGLILTDYLNYRENKIEIPREKLSGYKIYNYYFYKSLVVYVSHSNGKIEREHFNITLLKYRPSICTLHLAHQRCLFNSSFVLNVMFHSTQRRSLVFLMCFTCVWFLISVSTSVQLIKCRGCSCSTRW